MQPTVAYTREAKSLAVAEFDLAMSRRGFIGHRVFPLLTRDKPAGVYPKIKLEALLREEATDRMEGGGYPRSEGAWETDSYVTSEIAHEAVIDNRKRAAYADILDAKMWETMRCEDIVLRKYERMCAAAAFNATTFSSYKTTITNEWDDYANADPLGDINTGREAIVTAFGQEPNALIINRNVFRNLRRVDQILDVVKQQNYQDASQITDADLARFFDLDYVFVAGGITNTANEADARSISRIWSNEYALLCRVATTNDPGEACLGRTFMWGEEGAMSGNELAVIAEEYMSDEVRGTVVRARTDAGIEVIFTVAGHLFDNVTT